LPEVGLRDISQTLNHFLGSQGDVLASLSSNPKSTLPSFVSGHGEVVATL
jgi:hypothetical protein